MKRSAAAVPFPATGAWALLLREVSDVAQRGLLLAGLGLAIAALVLGSA